MREIAVVTVARSDFGIYLPLLRAISDDPRMRLRILVSGMHLSPEFGLTVREIQEAGFKIFEQIHSLLSSDTPSAIAKSIGVGVLGFGQLLSKYKPDILVVLGDRFDMLPAALAALPFRIPIAHIHGGEVTEGVIDDAIRHSLSKMSHLHFVATEMYARRLRQMGEEDWRIVVTGALSLDLIRLSTLMPSEEILTKFGIDARRPSLLVTYHPVTLEVEDTERQIMNLLAALSKIGLPCLFTYPNADTSGKAIIDHIEGYCKDHPESRVIRNAGSLGYLSLMNFVSAMVGNSSSGIVEAASFKLPVVNIGTRQHGRIHPANVVTCGYEREEVFTSLRKALSTEFKESLRKLSNPYGDGHAAERIVARLVEIPLGKRVLVKRFVDRPSI